MGGIVGQKIKDMDIANFINNKGPWTDSFRRPFVIAEAGVNHEADMDLAYRLINEAKEGGADAIKFQSYKAETIASKHSPYYWDLDKEPTKSQYKLFKKYDHFWKNEFEQLKRYCDQIEIEFLSTPFDLESAIFLNDLMSAYKVSSSDLNNKPFISFICGFHKPIILSTGASYIDEIDRSVKWITSAGNRVALLHCILNYPTDNSNANLSMMCDLQKRFPDLMIGYSDHTLPQQMKILEMSVLLGAKIIEKHFTFDKSLPGNDHYHAMDKEDLKLLNRKIDEIESILGGSPKEPIETEFISRRNARRSLVLSCNLKKGDYIYSECLTWKRPGTGIEPSEIEKVLGLTVNKDLEIDHILNWEDINK